MAGTGLSFFNFEVFCGVCEKSQKKKKKFKTKLVNDLKLCKFLSLFIVKPLKTSAFD